jgi:hypothetical protein
LNSSGRFRYWQKSGQRDVLIGPAAFSAQQAVNADDGQEGDCRSSVKLSAV